VLPFPSFFSVSLFFRGQNRKRLSLPPPLLFFPPFPFPFLFPWLGGNWLTTGLFFLLFFSPFPCSFPQNPSPPYFPLNLREIERNQGARFFFPLPPPFFCTVLPPISPPFFLLPIAKTAVEKITYLSPLFFPLFLFPFPLPF